MTGHPRVLQTVIDATDRPAFERVEPLEQTACLVDPAGDPCCAFVVPDAGRGEGRGW